MTPEQRDDLKALILECLAIHADRTPKRKRKAKITGPTTADPELNKHIYALSRMWLECIGAVDIGRIGKAMKPLLALYEVKWIEAGIRAYAHEAVQGTGLRYASVENFASRASGYILPALPSNELTEREAKLMGQDSVMARANAAAMGQLSERARQ